MLSEFLNANRISNLLAIPDGEIPQAELGFPCKEICDLTLKGKKHLTMKALTGARSRSPQMKVNFESIERTYLTACNGKKVLIKEFLPINDTTMLEAWKLLSISLVF
jgi:hypothetical protein